MTKSTLLLEDNLVMLVSECCSDPVKDLQGKDVEIKVKKEIEGPISYEIPSQKGKCSWCGNEIDVPRVALRVF